MWNLYSTAPVRSDGVDERAKHIRVIAHVCSCRSLSTPMAEASGDGVVNILGLSFLTSNGTAPNAPPVALYTSSVGNPYFFTGRCLHFMKTLHDGSPEDVESNWQVQLRIGLGSLNTYSSKLPVTPIKTRLTEP